MKTPLFTEQPWVRPFLVIAFVWLMLFSNLGGYDLSAPDEPRFALVAHEMLQNNHWLQPHRNDRPYPDKPPLFFWSIAFVSALNGGEVTALTARLPSALAAALVLYLMWGFASGHSEPKEKYLGLLTVLVLLCSFRFFFQARMAQIDMLLCGLTTAAGCLGFYLVSGQVAHEKRPQAQRSLGILLGLAILTKGPVGYLVPAGAMAVFAVFCGRECWSRFPRKALLWGLLPPLVWIGLLFIEVMIGGHWDYFNNLLFKQTVVRYLNPWHHYKPFFYFGQVLFYDFMPWIFVLLAAIPWRKRLRIQLTPQQKYAWATVIFTLIFFSLSKGKRNLYIVPLYPFAAFLVATHIRHILSRVQKSPIWSMALPAIPLILVCVVFTIAGLGYLDGYIPERINIPIPKGPFLVVGVLGLMVGVWGLYQSMAGRGRQAFGSLVLVMALINILFYQVAQPVAAPLRSARAFMEQATEMIDCAPETVGMVQYRSAYRFYGKYPLLEVSPPVEELSGLPTIDEFWEAHPDGWLFMRRKHLDEYLETGGTEPQIHLQVTVGRGQDMLLITHKR